MFVKTKAWRLILSFQTKTSYQLFKKLLHDHLDSNVRNAIVANGYESHPKRVTLPHVGQYTIMCLYDDLARIVVSLPVQ